MIQRIKLFFNKNKMSAVHVPDGKKYIIYLKTTKTAGTSILEFLKRSVGFLTFEELRNSRDDNIGKIIVVAQDQVSLFIKEFSDIWDQSFRFAVVRNPYDRFVSGWLYHSYSKNEKISDLLDNLPAPEINPSTIEWKKVLPQADWELYSAYNHLTATQSEFLVIGGELIVDRVLYFEQLDTDFISLCNDFGIECLSGLPKSNKTKGKRRDFLAYYGENEIKLLNNKFKDDFVNFNYKMKIPRSD